MPSRFLLASRSLMLMLALVAGSTVSLALADDGGGSNMESKPADPPAATETKEESPKDAAPAKAEVSARDAREQRAKDAGMLADFVHYVLIDRADLAQSMGQGLLDRKIEPRDFASMVDSGIGYRRFTQAVNRAQRRTELESIAAAFIKLYEGGKLSTARNPESIDQNIKLLTGDLRQRMFARERLIEAGEYATPQLLTALLGGGDVKLSSEVRQLLVDMGRQSVMPLCAALPKLQPSDQETVASILGDIGQPQAGPFLHDLSASTQNQSVRNAAESAIRRSGAGLDPLRPLPDRYVDLADAYLKGSPSLISFPSDGHQLIWTYDPAAGLYFQAVDTAVFGPTMAMKLTEAALRKEGTSARAVSTWIAANFTREIRTPDGYEHPIYGKDKRDGQYFAVAAGPDICQSVLGRALDSNETPLARKALAALEKTGGRTVLGTATSTERRPMVDALRYPNRRVQYDAALAIGASQPREGFPGSEQVVRTLASSIRDASAKYALVVARSTEEQSALAKVFRDSGYTLLAPATRLDDAAQSIAETPGLDIIVTSLPSDSTGQLIEQAQSDAKLRATPILALLSAQGYAEQTARFARNPLVRLGREGLSAKDVQNAAELLINSASGGLISGEEAAQYRTRALSVLRDIGVSSSPVLNVGDAQGPLLTALPEAKDETKSRIAEVLSYISSKQAQSALFDAAMTVEGTSRVELLGQLAASARRFGNQLDSVQVDALVDVTKTGKGEEATAAAAALGALNLRGGNVVPLILGSDEKK